MKSLTIFLALTFSVMFSSSLYADWTKASKNTSGNTYYVDFERIKKHDGYVYWWELGDYAKPTKYGDLSAKVYNQGECKLIRYKHLSFFHHGQPMGGGTGEKHTPENPKWIYPPPNSVAETILQSVCNR